MRLRFQTKVALFVALVLIGIQAVNIVSVVSSTREAAFKDAERQMERAAAVFTEHVANLTTELGERARIVSLDFSFREAIAVGDEATQASAIENLKTRLGADRGLLLSLEGEILVDTASPEMAGGYFSYPGLLDLAGENGDAVAILALGDDLYGFTLVPVLAPVPVAWIGIGVDVDGELLSNLQDLASIPLGISFLRRGSGGGWIVASSTETDAGLAELAQVALRADPGKAQLMTLGDAEHVVFVANAEQAHPDAAVREVLHYSLEDALDATEPLITSMIAFMAVALTLGLVGAALMARGISKPIVGLVRAAERVREGDYKTPVVDPGGKELGQLSGAMNEMMRDIMEREERLEFQARFDALTKLPNRREFLRWLNLLLEDAIARDRPLWVAIFGVDRLQEFNNTLGYQVGDRLIDSLARRLAEKIGQDGCVARMGSDLFSAILTDCRPGDCMREVGAILRDVNSPLTVGGVTVDIAVRCGVAAPRDREEDAETLLRHADIALYRARQTRKRTHLFDPEKDTLDPDRLSLMGEMETGLNAGQFHLVYQPKVDLASDGITQAEALIRWIHPTRGLMPPDDFIPLAEQTGAIRILSRWVLAESVRQLAAWSREGVELGLAVNLSTQDLTDTTLPDYLGKVLDDHGVGRGSLVLEVTESAIMDDPEAARKVLCALAETGYRLSVDDYGAGYSSMSYLTQLPVHEMKIDKSFVLNLSSNRKDEVVVRSSVELAHNLGLKVTAEGVEDVASYEKLKTLKCDMAQGYFISKPVKADELVDTYRSGAWTHRLVDA